MMNGLCKFCEEQFEQRSTNHQFCSVSCRDWFNKTKRPLAEIMMIDWVIMNATGYYEPLQATIRDLEWVLPEDELRIGFTLNERALKVVLTSIEEHGANFEARDLQAMEDAALTCDRVARRAQRWAAKLRQ